MSQALSASKEISFAQGYAMLQKEGVEPKAQPELKDGQLPLAEFRFATSVFQPRLGDGTTAESDAHVAALADGIRNAKDHKLDPVLIWWSGRKWMVIDGHHRLMAYSQVNNPDQAKASRRWVSIDRIPVEIFEGTLDEALVEATARNTKDKLKMTKKDKLERAWKFTTLRTMTIPAIANATGVAERTVGNMRKADAELGKVAPGDFTATVDTRSITWDQAKRLIMGERIVDDEWVEKTAADWAKKLAKTLGNKLAQNPQMTLRALEIYSDRLPARLVEIYREENGPGEDEE